ncbi:MAG TPA: hypothetical protein VFV41_01715 [Streptosporangiaceae bacterium]|nr:hypothetical protein [Streptosporangiaceae bacterium]
MLSRPRQEAPGPDRTEPDPALAAVPARGRHEEPVPLRARAVTALLGIAWIGSSIAAFAIAFALTDVHGPVQPGLHRYQQTGLGAALVGAGAAGLVFVIGAQVSVIRDGRRHPNHQYKGKYSRH